jgi:quercetin dioxygenase-like cupin family protein
LVTAVRGRAMKRHRSLVALSHDHHRTLVEARRLRAGADADTAERSAVAEAFLRYFSGEVVRHFRIEEERLFPILTDGGNDARELLVRALLDHQHLHALVFRLQGSISTESDGGLMRGIADSLTEHTRFEERELFPFAESFAGEHLEGVELTDHSEGGADVVDLMRPLGRGPVWGIASGDLNATLLVWAAGHGVSSHVNRELDVLLVVLAGSATVTIEGERNELEAGDAVVSRKGLAREVVAGPDGVRYISVHQKRPPLEIAPPPAPRRRQRTRADGVAEREG